MSATTKRGWGAALAALALACSSGNDTTPPPVPPAFTQADLTGEWDAMQLGSNSSPRWGHTHLSVAADGKVALLSILENGGPGTLPGSIDQKLAITADGTVTLGGADAPPTFHGSMTSRKTLIFATLTEGNGAMDLLVIRKRVAGVTFAPADVANVAFAYHAVQAGSSWSWEYGDGTTDASGALTIAHQVDAGGPIANPPPPGFLTLTIDAAGVIGYAGAPGVMSGVMSSDKKSLFLLQTIDPGTPPGVQLIVVTLTGKAFTSADLAGRYGFHLLTSGASTAGSAWSHGAFAIDAQGLVTFSSVLDSQGGVTLPTPFNLAIDAGGALTLPGDPSYHGQMAWNGDFYVRTGNAPADPASGVMVLSSR